MRRSVFIVSAILGLIWACGNDASPSGDAVGTPDASGGETTEYSGVWAGPNGETGTVDFTFTNATGVRTQTVAAGATLRGTLRLNTILGPITLTGVVDTTGATVRVSGTAEGALGKFECADGRLRDGYFTMTCVGADGQPRYVDSRLISADRIDRYCGLLKSEAGQSVGAFNLFTQGSLAGAVMWADAYRGGAAGTRNGDKIAMQVPGQPGSFDLQLDSAGVLTGAYAFSNALGRGSVVGSKDACPGAAGGPSTVDSGVDSGSRDASTDQGTDASQPLPDGAVDAGSDADASADASAVDASGVDANGVDAGADASAEAGTDAAADAAAPDSGPDAGVGVCGSTGKLVDLAPTDYVSYVAATGGYVFYVLNGTELWRAPVNQTASPSLFHTAAQSTGFWGLRTEGSNVCWLEGANNPQTPGTLACKPANGGASITVVNNLVTPEGLFMRAGELYWFSRTNRQIYKAPAVSNATYALKYNLAVDNPSDKPAWVAQDSVTHLASDGSKIFFVTYNYQLFQSRVYSIAEGAVSTGSGNPVLATDVSGAGNQIAGLTSDGRFTFWLRSPASPLVGLLAVVDNQNVNTGTMNNYVQDGSQLVSWPGEGVAYFSYKYGIAKQAASHSGFETSVTGAGPIAGDAAVRAIALDNACVYWFGENAGRGVFAAQR